MQSITKLLYEMIKIWIKLILNVNNNKVNVTVAYHLYEKYYRSIQVLRLSICPKIRKQINITSNDVVNFTRLGFSQIKIELNTNLIDSADWSTCIWHRFELGMFHIIWVYVNSRKHIVCISMHIKGLYTMYYRTNSSWRRRSLKRYRAVI